VTHITAFVHSAIYICSRIEERQSLLLNDQNQIPIMIYQLDHIFKARSIAVIGASSTEDTVGHALLDNLIGSGYEGVVYPVNPKRNSVQSVKSYPSVLDIGEPIDLAVIATPARTVPFIVTECGKAGVKGIVIISAGFSEAGDKGKTMVREILDIAQSYEMRILGPNCLGFLNPHLKINASFAGVSAKPGKIAFISQSGALCTAILDWANDQNVGFSHFVSIGSMIDVSYHDLIDYFGNDPNTSSILMYMESLTNARKFMSAARAFARNKPIIVLKSGKSEAGASAAASHTGAMAGNDIIFDAAFDRAGIVRVDTIEGLFKLAQVLAMQNRPTGNRLAIITNAGGPGVLATDQLMKRNGVLAPLSEETITSLNEVLPPTWSHGNPVDVIGDADVERYQKAVKICLKDKYVDAVLVILAPQAMTDSGSVAEALVGLGDETKKTFLACWMGAEEVQEGRDILENGNIPVFGAPEEAVDCFMQIVKYKENINLLYETPSTIPSAFTPDMDKNKALIANVVQSGRHTMTEFEAKRFLSNYDIPVVKNAIATTEEDALRFSHEIGYPLAMKIVSPDILHKTDVGGVHLNIRNNDEMLRAFNEIMESAKRHAPDADIQGVLLEQMQSKKYELIIGSKKDPIIGPAIIFGMGGVAVEVFKDMRVGLPPLNMALAQRIIERTRIYKLLKGYRGMPGVDISAIQFLLYKFAYLLVDFPEIMEIDINPFGVDENGGVVLDAKVILDQDVIGKEMKDYAHLVIHPYPKEYITSFTMKNGKKAVLRPIRPEDEPLEAEMFTRLSRETQYLRFFSYLSNITHEMLVRFTHNDYDREIAIIAEVNEQGVPKMAGVARLVADADNKTAEFAIVIADPWHHLGLGNKLTDYILEIAREKQIKKVYAMTLKQNKDMIHMFKKRGFSLKLVPEEEAFHAELVLSKHEIYEPHLQ
jgi:acetyltransferase